MREFTHINATSLDDAVAKLGEYGDKAMLNAGGTDLLGTLRFELLETYPEAVINLKSITPSLDYIKEEGGMLKIGALTRLEDIAKSDIVNSRPPAKSSTRTSIQRATGTLNRPTAR